MALHGWFGSARGWGSLPDYLDGSAFTYVFPDLRGYGSRRDVTGDFTMAKAAADALALADELGWERFSLVGQGDPARGAAGPRAGPAAGGAEPGAGHGRAVRRRRLGAVQRRRHRPEEPRRDHHHDHRRPAV